jgi:DNA repair exonuclease SbcCD ATPase subunit
MAEASKDMVIERLKKENDELKERLKAGTFENFTQKIQELEQKIQNKDKEIADLKTATSAGGEGGDVNEIRTRLIIAQSKIRTSDQKITQMTTEKEELEAKLKRQDGKSADNEQVEVLKRQLRQEMETSDRLRSQLNRAPGGSNPQLEQEVQQLRQQLQAAQAQSKSGGAGISQVGGASSSGDVGKLKQELAARDQKIALLEKDIASASSASAGGATGPMANLRLQREINALKSQIEMLKKSEAEMRQKYQQAMKKDEFVDM